MNSNTKRNKILIDALKSVFSKKLLIINTVTGSANRLCLAQKGYSQQFVHSNSYTSVVQYRIQNESQPTCIPAIQYLMALFIILLQCFL